MKSVFFLAPLSSLILALPAIAQVAPVTQPLGGPEIPGLCLLSRQAIYANAAVGKAASARLAQIAQDVQVEMDAERKPLEADMQTFQTDAAKMTPAQRTQRQQALQPRIKALQDKTQLRSQEIEATREKALANIANAAQPVIAQVYTQHKCGMLMDRNSVLGGNMANDLTADVVKGVDAKITTISFNREVLPPQPSKP